MTWAPTSDEYMMGARADKVRIFAERCGVTDCIITSKGEPMMNYSLLLLMLDKFGESFPVTLQTNGLLLQKENKQWLHDRLRRMSAGGLNGLAISIDTVEGIRKVGPIWSVAKAYGLVTRAVINVTPAIAEQPWKYYVNECANNEVQQLTFRHITRPERIDTRSVAAYDAVGEIQENESVKRWHTEYHDLMQFYKTIRRLPYGARIEDVFGIAVTWFEYCVQDTSGEDDIRSLIFHQDGHLYTTWTSPASRIF